MDLLLAAASLDHVGMIPLREGLVIVLLWIGALKFADYEAESIDPLVTNSPLLKYFYRFRAPEHRKHPSPEGHLKALDHQWSALNRTYLFSRMLGCMFIAIGFSIGLEFTSPRTAAAGSVLLALMSLTTLSFLVTTPEAWVRSSGPWVPVPFREWGGSSQKTALCLALRSLA